VDVDWLIANGFITTATALDTRVETLGGTDQIHMMAEDRIMAFCPSLASDSQLNWYLSTGNTALADFPVIVGDGGYVNITDHAGLELGNNNFSIEFEGWVDTSQALTLIEKADTFKLETGGSDNITATIHTPDDIEQLNTDTSIDLFSGATIRAGERIDDFPPGTVSQVSFQLNKQGVPPGTVYVRLRRVSDDGVIGTFGSVATAGIGGVAWHDFTTDVYNPVRQDVRFTVEYNDGGDAGNRVFVRRDTGNPYADGVYTDYIGAWADDGTDDATFKLQFGADVVLTANSISLGELTVKVAGNSSDFVLYVDGVVEDDTPCEPTVDNADNWHIVNLPYFNYYEHTINGTLIAWYQPISYIVGTTLPDREGAAQNGTITWGTNPAGVNVTLGSLTAPESTVTIEEEAGGYQGAMHNVGVTDWFLEPDVGTKLATHPFRPLITIWSDNSTVTEVQAWRFLGLALLLLITVVAAVMVRGHLLIAGLACGGTIALLVQQTVWPGWTLVFIIPAIIAGVMAERTPSIG